ncbi:hypothetical protein MNBD_GAMMA03-1181 [hydrothermal vent metagenome]|uniref:Uncharacterized protein n=1 Tax=hydrothermal vent metagenome TaxID=652676 RepID=A0A3B0W4L0_9ZZZZ
MKAIFYLTDEGFTCYKENETIVDTFQWEEVVLIDAYLAKFPEETQVSLIIDVVEEDIYFEWAPKLLPWEKAGFLERRKARFPSEEFALTKLQWTNSLKESEGGRKEELILVSLLANDEVFSSLLTKLEEAQILVTNIYTKPFLLVEYFKIRVKSYLKLSKKELEQPFLVVIRVSEYAFRQIFFYEGHLRISRLVELDRDTTDMTRALVHETKLAIAYIRSQNLMPVDSNISLVFLDSDPKILSGLFEICKEEGLFLEEKGKYFFKGLTFNELTKNKQYLSFENARCFSQPAMVDFILTDRPAGFYSNKYTEKIKGFLLGRQVFIGLNILLLLGGLYYIVMSSVDTYVSWKKQEILEQKIVAHQTEVKRLKEVVKFQDDAEQVKASVEFSDVILKLKLDRPVNFDIYQWSDVFERHEHIQISRMEWALQARFDSRKTEIILDAWVFPFYDTYKDPVKWIDAFIEDLKNLPGVENVELQKEPLNRNLSQQMIIDATKEPIDALPFTVKIRVKDIEPK